MKVIDSKTYTGKIKNFKGQFGFIEYELGDLFFHKSGLKGEYYPEQNDEIEFQLQPSPKKTGKSQAYEIVLIKKEKADELDGKAIDHLIGVVKWFDEKKGFGVIGTPEKIDYFLRKEDVQSRFIFAGNVVVFYSKNYNGKNIAKKCRHAFGYNDWKMAFAYAGKDDTITVEFVEERIKPQGYGTYKHIEKENISIIRNTLHRLLKQRDSLSNMELRLLSLDLLQTDHANEGYKLTKQIISSSNHDDEDRKAFLKSAFEFASAEYGYYMVFVDDLIDIQKESTEVQIKHMQKFESLDINKIKVISQSTKIDDQVRTIFLNSTFERASNEFKYKMLFEGLIILNEDQQLKFLLEYLSELSSNSYSVNEKIKYILNSDKIADAVRSAFLNSLFEKASVEYKYEMLIVGLIIPTEEQQIKFLQEFISELGQIRYLIERITFITQSGKFSDTVKFAFLNSLFEKASYQYKYDMIFEELIIPSEEQQIKLLQEFLAEPGYIGYSRYNWIKFIAQSDKFIDEIKIAFLNSTFQRASVKLKYEMICEGLIIPTEEQQIKFMQEYISKLDKIDTSNFNQIKYIALSDKIDEALKKDFLRSAFEIADVDYQYLMVFDDNIINIQNESTEYQREVLKKFENCDIDSIKAISQSERIEETVKKSFLKSVFEKADDDWQYRMIFEDKIINIHKESKEYQLEVLRRFEIFNIDRIKAISQSESIEDIVKKDFLESVFEKTNADCQYRIIFEDNVIEIQNETTEAQLKLLRKLKELPIDKIIAIAQSDKIQAASKNDFLHSVFEKSNVDCQYRMIFDDNLIDIQNETTEDQYKLLRKFNSLDIDKIKVIAQSEKIHDALKNDFLQSVFEKSSADRQYKMLFDYNMVNNISNKLNFLIKSTLVGKLRFEKGKYQGKTYFEVLEKDIEYLHKNNNHSGIQAFYMVEKGYWSRYGGKRNEYDLSDKYKEWKESWLAIMEDINRVIENQEVFAVENSEEFIWKVTQINDVRELANIYQIEFNENGYKIAIKNAITRFGLDLMSYITNYQLLSVIKQYDSVFYSLWFEQIYPHISKIDRLRLWLHNLNPYYNYLEFVQSAWQLSNDERKLLNKRIKEHAKAERLQKFIDQIPVAELIMETLDDKTYKCKWRNLYYRDGSIQVFFDKYNSSESYLWESAREEWNLLTQEYFNNRRIDDIIATVNNYNQIIKIKGLENIEVKIVMAEVRKNGSTERKINISSSQIAKIIHNISARNQCINFLARQNENYNVLDVQELVTDDLGSLRRDVSFMFPIPNGEGNIYLIWESAEFEKSKATHIFKCSEDELDDMEIKIKDFIEGNLRTRSRLNSVESNDLEVKRKLQYFCRVNHDTVDYQVWEKRMREVMPFLI